MKIKSFLWVYIAVQICSIAVMAQEKDISSYLKAIDEGRAAEVKKQIPALLKKNPNDASLLYLDAAVTPDGERAADKYTSLLQRYPKCKYADAAMYRLYGYYCARGMDKKANQIMAEIKQKFPKSKYLKQPDNAAPETVKTEVAVAKTPEKQERVPSAAQTKSKFTIQIGAFLSEANAKSLRDRVAKDNIIVNVKTKDIGGSMFYVVYAGGYSDENTAQKAVPNFNSQYSVKGRVVPVP